MGVAGTEEEDRVLVLSVADGARLRFVPLGDLLLMVEVLFASGPALAVVTFVPASTISMSVELLELLETWGVLPSPEKLLF